MPRWRDADGAVLIISYGVFNNAVKDTDSAAAGTAAVRLGRLSPAATGSVPSSRPSSGNNSMDDAEHQNIGDAGDGEAEEELVPLEPLRRKSAAEIREVRCCSCRMTATVGRSQTHLAAPGWLAYASQTADVHANQIAALLFGCRHPDFEPSSSYMPTVCMRPHNTQS